MMGMMLTPSQIVEASLGAALVAGLGFGGYMYQAMWPPARLFGPALRAPKRPGEIALTFDDGPNPRWTPELLDILADHNVKATFFLVGRYAATQHPLIQRMHGEGHLVGNHTWNHPNLAFSGAEKTREELARTSLELEQITGAPVRYFRPPFGARRPATLRIARELGLTPVLWNAITSDWTATDPAQLVPQFTRLIESHQRQGQATNLVLHDGGHLSLDVNRAASIATAQQLIDRLHANHKFVNLDAWSE